MDNKLIHAVCIAAGVAVLAAVASIIERENNRINKPRYNRRKPLKKKLKTSDRMAIAVERDISTGSYSKSHGVINMEEGTEVHSSSAENDVECSSSTKRISRKRTRIFDDSSFEMLSKMIKEVALALRSLSKNELDVSKLYAEVMKTEGFDEDVLVEAFDHLMQNEMLAKAFIAKNANLRKVWIQNFVNKHTPE